ncbi:glutamate--cysteine ligase [Oceanirhabdus sp. W0125-5]|uniref:glutamate--cysteine ligase n=1 Tax=Oceanirhabdus sp. W0125-5 TaxID=2999116 RepID=UPI0022F32CB4|nr:glutamate-cysteine ligase family protein [Oceanirhabdus sp. W0125-5]WBW99523.1 glutamate-cysteine ligase family protein [Oceanirhabdus sp. W0125-5]
MCKDLFLKNIENIKNYLKSGETKSENYKIGMEVEHFIIKKDTGVSVDYFELNGIRDALKDLHKHGEWEAIFERDNIVGLKKNGSLITLEPGAQVEISVQPLEKIEDIEREYTDILKEIRNCIEKNNQDIAIIGYHPKSKIDEIHFIPKERYSFMKEYFKDKGKYALNMMKGTASTQISIDYESESDFSKKFRVANFLSPLIYCIFDNSPMFEGEEWKGNSLRIKIWNNCDEDRSGIVEGALDEEFNYESYARYIIERPPIITKINDEYIFTKDKSVKKIFNDSEMNSDEIEHILTMFFPDVRAKKYIEIRMADALPSPYNIAYAAFIKGIFYGDKSLDWLYNESLKYTEDDLINFKNEVVSYGLDAVIYNHEVLRYMENLLNMCEEELGDESRYLHPLYDLIKKKQKIWCLYK